MLRAPGPRDGHDVGGQDRAQDAADEATPARQDVPGDHPPQKPQAQIRGQTHVLLRRFREFIHLHVKWDSISLAFVFTVLSDTLS